MIPLSIERTTIIMMMLAISLAQKVEMNHLFMQMIHLSIERKVKKMSTTMRPRLVLVTSSEFIPSQNQPQLYILAIFLL